MQKFAKASKKKENVDLPRSSNCRKYVSACVCSLKCFLFSSTLQLVRSSLITDTHSLTVASDYTGEKETDYQVRIVCFQLFLRVDVTCLARERPANPIERYRKRKMELCYQNFSSNNSLRVQNGPILDIFGTTLTDISFFLANFA